MICDFCYETITTACGHCDCFLPCECVTPRVITNPNDVVPDGIYVVKIRMKNFVPPERILPEEKNIIYTCVAGLMHIDRIRPDSYFNTMSATPDKIQDLRTKNQQAQQMVSNVMTLLLDAKPVTIRVPGNSLIQANNRLRDYFKDTGKPHARLGKQGRVRLDIVEESKSTPHELEA